MIGPRTVPLADIRRDGDTQVRLQLSPEWVDELVALYRENHPIPPVILVLDADGTHWLADGYHRCAAFEKAFGAGAAIEATVIHGDMSTAKLHASQANKAGLPRCSGDKKRAIMMALEAERNKPTAQRMNQTQLAHHVGCTQQFVAQVISGTTSTCTTNDSLKETKPMTPNRLRRAKEDALALEELRKGPHRPNMVIQELTGCHDRRIAALRKEHGIPKYSQGNRVAMKELFDREPEWSADQYASELGCSPSAIYLALRDMGYPAPKRPAVKASAVESPGHGVSLPTVGQAPSDRKRKNHKHPADGVPAEKSNSPVVLKIDGVQRPGGRWLFTDHSLTRESAYGDTAESAFAELAINIQSRLSEMFGDGSIRRDAAE
jgi:hypothetical protein